MLEFDAEAHADPRLIHNLKSFYRQGTVPSDTQMRELRLNTELARKDPACLEYVLVHELAHLREPDHGEAFVRLLSEAMPSWRERRDRLNQSPARHENWSF